MLAELDLSSAIVYSLERLCSVADACLLVWVTCCSIALIELFKDVVWALIKPVVLAPAVELALDAPMAPVVIFLSVS